MSVKRDQILYVTSFVVYMCEILFWKEQDFDSFTIKYCLHRSSPIFVIVNLKHKAWNYFESY